MISIADPIATTIDKVDITLWRVPFPDVLLSTKIPMTYPMIIKDAKMRKWNGVTDVDGVLFDDRSLFILLTLHPLHL